jgi:hypothetical protein
VTLWAHVYSGYASYGNVHPWHDDEHVAHKFIQILKGEVPSGYAWLPRPNGTKVKITNAQPAGAFEVWGSFAAQKAAQIYPNGAYLIPIPTASCLAIGDDPKGRTLANVVAERLQGFEALDALHWNEQFVKASKGGPRDPDILFGNVQVRTDLEKRPVILIDDVITGGGHAIACARALRWAGHEVRHVIAAAHTVKAPPANGMFNIEAWDLEDDGFKVL